MNELARYNIYATQQPPTDDDDMSDAEAGSGNHKEDTGT